MKKTAKNKKLWKELQQKLLYRDNYKCVFCKKPVNLKHFQSCHIIPEEFEETRYDLNNLLLACFYHLIFSFYKPMPRPVKP